MVQSNVQTNTVKTWLTLSKASEPYEKQIAFKDLVKPTIKFFEEEGMSPNIQFRRLVVQVAKKIWKMLYRQGLVLHPSIQSRYKDQGACIWCGGGLRSTTDINGTSSEVRCEDCTFIYEEK